MSNIHFIVACKYHDEGGVYYLDTDVLIQLDDNECKRLEEAELSGVPFSEDSSVRDIYERILEKSIQIDCEIFKEHCEMKNYRAFSEGVTRTVNYPEIIEGV